ncbi:MAG TPA: RES family NAD+ phosphorylase [Longimicrobiales bacterium]|nr:RES family NAD+ phosphorylase [Longimicrobiales bacterium]
MELKPTEPPRRRIRWRTCYRVIPSRFPPIDLFERVAGPDDLAAVHELESLTNDRLREQLGQIHMVPATERVAGPGAGYVMAAFTHPAPAGARFNDGRVGAYYAGRTLETAIAESTFHRAKFMRATRERPMELDMRVLEAELDARLHDLRGRRDTLPDIYHPDDYGTSQRLAAQLRADGSDGIAYDSVRHAGGQCVAIFRPRRIRSCRASLHLTYVWDGTRIAQVYEKREYPGD